MRNRTILQVNGPTGVGKTAFIEQLICGLDEFVTCIRGKREPSLRRSIASASRNDAEIRRYKAAGASATARFLFPPDQFAADDFFTSDVMQEYSTVVIVEGDCPLEHADFSIFIAPPLKEGEALWVRRERDDSRDREKLLTMLENMLENSQTFLEQMEGMLGISFPPEFKPHEISDKVRQETQATLEKIRGEPPLKTVHWAVAPRYEQIEHAHLVVVNHRDERDAERCDRTIREIARLRKEDSLFNDVLGFRGRRTPITVVSASVITPKDKGRKKASARIKRAIELCRK